MQISIFLRLLWWSKEAIKSSNSFMQDDLNSTINSNLKISTIGDHFHYVQIRRSNIKGSVLHSVLHLITMRWKVVRESVGLFVNNLLLSILRIESALVWGITKLANTIVRLFANVQMGQKNIHMDVSVLIKENSLTKNLLFLALKVISLFIIACPPSTFPHEGLCVDCPNNCATCEIDGFHRMFLECKVCEKGYYLDDGQCFKDCNTNLGSSMATNGTCIKCSDPHCVDCSMDANICSKCSLLYVLSNGTCLRKFLLIFRKLPSKHYYRSSLVFWFEMLTKWCIGLCCVLNQ